MKIPIAEIKIPVLFFDASASLSSVLQATYANMVKLGLLSLSMTLKKSFVLISVLQEFALAQSARMRSLN